MNKLEYVTTVKKSCNQPGCHIIAHCAGKCKPHHLEILEQHNKRRFK